VKVFKNFKEVAQVRPGFSIEAIYGGALLGIAGADFIAFYDWTTATVGTAAVQHTAHDRCCTRYAISGRTLECTWCYT
jgi:Coatomer WD associated region